MAKNYGPQRLPNRKDIEVTGQNIKLRVAALIIFLVIGIGGIVIGITGALNKESGWTRVTVNSGYPVVASADLDFEYYLGKKATAEYKQVSTLFSEASYRAYQVYHPTQAYPDLGNLCSVNDAPNQELTVAPELYRAFALLQSKNCRALFLAPVYAQYDAVFRSQSDEEAAIYDPLYSEEAAAYVEELMGFVSDPDAISLDLLGNNRVRLNVREDYLRFAEENEIGSFLNFYFLKNAFVLDDIAAELREAGLVHGYIASREGFVRYLDPAETDFTLELISREAEGIAYPAQLRISGALQLVCMHAYGSGSADYFYEYADGTERTPYLDPVTGACRAAIQDLTLLSRSASLAEMAIDAFTAFSAEQWDSAPIAALSQSEIGAVWCEGKTLYNTALPAALNMKQDEFTEKQIN